MKREANKQMKGALMAVFMLALNLTTVAAGLGAMGGERAVWRFELNNDYFFGSDNNLTNGLALLYHSDVASDWADLKGFSRSLSPLGKLVPKTDGDHQMVRFSLSIRQTMQTPDDLTKSELIQNDVPYAGILILQGGWYRYSDSQLIGLGLSLGVSGPLSLAGPMQRGFHRLIHSTVPRGWPNQLNNELLVNLSLMSKVKLIRFVQSKFLTGDLSVGALAALGNLNTHISAVLEMRLGYNVPGGFANGPDPSCYDLPHQATLRAEKPDEPSLFLSVGLRGMALARTLFLDGNLFGESHRVDRRCLLGQVNLGVHLLVEPWGLTFQLTSVTPLVRLKDRSKRFQRDLYGTIDLSLGF